mmetsp:Transcript_6286/g.19054  ORF Transcript_6286/g.19054 Transcript_6286/m.19054 type:complete len:201 (+) Transcript_6286:1050-1652(+)
MGEEGREPQPAARPTRNPRESQQPAETVVLSGSIWGASVLCGTQLRAASPPRARRAVDRGRAACEGGYLSFPVVTFVLFFWRRQTDRQRGRAGRSARRGSVNCHQSKYSSSSRSRAREAASSRRRRRLKSANLAKSGTTATPAMLLKTSQRMVTSGLARSTACGSGTSAASASTASLRGKEVLLRRLSWTPYVRGDLSAK